MDWRTGPQHAHRAAAVVMMLAVAATAGCAARIPKDALRLPESSLEIRSMQTRTFEAPDESVIIAASVGALQDMEYNLDEVERPLGVLTASKVVDADSTAEKIGFWVGVLLCGAGGTVCGDPSTLQDEQKIVVTLVVLPSLANKNEFTARVTLQRIVFDKQGRVLLMEALGDAETYQDIFERLSQAIFLQVNQA